MPGKSPIFATQNFAANLDSIEAFLSGDKRQTLQSLLKRLFDDICPILAQLPLSGSSFFAHRERSKDAQLLVRRLKRKLEPGDDLRELGFDDYVLLYLVRRKRIYLVAIKHHRQLSFDLRSFWS
jgi:hypothetical protein